MENATTAREGKDVCSSFSIQAPEQKLRWIQRKFSRNFGGCNSPARFARDAPISFIVGTNVRLGSCTSVNATTNRQSVTEIGVKSVKQVDNGMALCSSSLLSSIYANTTAVFEARCNCQSLHRATFYLKVNLSTQN